MRGEKPSRVPQYPIRPILLTSSPSTFRVKKLVQSIEKIMSTSEKRSSIPKGTYDLQKSQQSKPSSSKKRTLASEAFGIQSSNLTLPVDTSPDVVFLHMENSVRRFAFNKVQVQSQGTYMTGWNHFEKYASMNAFDLNLQTVPFYLEGVQLTIPFIVTAFSGFIIYCVQEVGVKPSTAIGNYAAGALFYLENGLNVDVRAIKNSWTYRACKAGITLEETIKNPKWKTSKLPMTVESIVFAKSDVFNDSSDPVQKAIIVYFEFQFITLARVSECLLFPQAEAHHHLLSNEVQFMIRTGPIGRLITIYVAAHDVNMEMLTECELIDVIITRSSTKADYEGCGNNFSFSATDKPSNAFNLAKDMFDWAAHAQLKTGDAFFSYRQAWALTYNQANEAIKDTMKRLGFIDNLHQFSTHSMRIGGASTLVAAGFSDSIIQKMGGWKSLAFLKYIRLAVEAFGKCQDALTDISLLTNNHLVRMLPGFNARSPETLAESIHHARGSLPEAILLSDTSTMTLTSSPSSSSSSSSSSSASQGRGRGGDGRGRGRANTPRKRALPEVIKTMNTRQTKTPTTVPRTDSA